MVSCLILLGSFCVFVSPLFFSSQPLLWKSVSSLCLFTHLFHVSVSVPQLSHVSVWSAFCLPVYVSSLVLFHPLSLQSVMYLFIPSPSVYHVLVWVSVCVTSHLICPYVLMPVSLFSFTSSVFPGVFHLPNYVVSLSLQCHIAVIHPLMLCALFLHFSLVSM